VTPIFGRAAIMLDIGPHSGYYYYYRQHCVQHKRWYISYSAASFEVFHPAGATHCTSRGEIWHGGMDRGPLSVHSSVPNFIPIGCNDKGIGPPKLNFLLRLYQNWEYKLPTGAYPLHDFHKICKNLYLVSGCVSC